MEHWSSDADRKKKSSGRNTCLNATLPHKSYIDWSRIESGSPWFKDENSSEFYLGSLFVQCSEHAISIIKTTQLMVCGE
jgi:hypothetical protein